ncbi:hypothetical protein D3C83_197000 [compost metagenome]
MLQLGGVMHFGAEPLDAEAGHQVGRQELDDDLALEEIFAGHEDARHASARNLPDHVIAGPESRLQVVAQF